MPRKPPKSQSHDFIKIYEQYGLSFNGKQGDNKLADCPKCEREKKLSIKVDTGQYRCLNGACGWTGNVYSFFSWLIEEGSKQTHPKVYKQLTEIRKGIPAKAFQNAGFVVSPLCDEWLLPLYNHEGKICNVGRYDERTGRILSAPELPVLPSGLNQLARLSGIATIYVCEGYWDWTAWSWLLSQTHLKPNTYAVVGVPGSDTIVPDGKQAHWVDWFMNHHIVNLYDNDEAGLKGMAKFLEVLNASKNRYASVKTINWPGGLHDGYDMEDFVRDHLTKPVEALDHFNEMIVHAKDCKAQPAERTTCTSWEDLVDTFRDNLHTTQSYEDSLAFTTTTVISPNLPGDPIWGFLVSQPSAGKSTLLQAFTADPTYAEGISKLSSQALISGWRSQDGGDPSLLPTLNGRALIIKDYTAVKKLPITIQEELYGLLRDVYDGHAKVPFGNDQYREYKDIHFGLVAGVTDIIHGDNRATLGERFLKCEFLGEDIDEDELIDSALDGFFVRDQRAATLSKSVLGYLDHVTAKLKHDVEANLEEPGSVPMPVLPPEIRVRIKGLAKIVAGLRAGIDSDRVGRLNYRPRPEIGTRLAVQLARYGTLTCYTFGVDHFNADVCRNIQKIALDTAVGFPLEICQHLYQFQEGGLTIKRLHERMGVSEPTCRRHVNNLLEFGFVTSSSDSNGSGSRGRNSDYYVLSEPFKLNWEQAMISPDEEVRKNYDHTKKNGRYKIHRNQMTTSSKYEYDPSLEPPDDDEE